MHKIVLPLFLLILAGKAYTQNFNRSANGELALRAFAKCYPAKTGAVEYIDNDWTIAAGGETFFWAGGRLLPRAEKDDIDSWEPHFFGIYPETTPSPDSYPPQYVDLLRTRGTEQIRPERKDTHPYFQGILYGGIEREEVEAKLVRIDFLNFKVTIHQDIAAALRRIDAEIRKRDPAFIDSIASIGGYNWREIAGTRRMSYHSWGMAVDIQPKALGNKSIYWQWEQRRNRDWMLIPLEERWNPPDPVIKAFEREGFIWGGKWPFYDNMHFEYRPELHELTRLLSTNQESTNTGKELHHIAPDFLLK